MSVRTPKCTVSTLVLTLGGGCVVLAVLCAPPVISDCGSGGQILADAATIQAVRSQLHLLGVVTASGLDYRLDTGRRRAAAASCLQACR